MFLTGHLQDYHSVFPEYFLYSPNKPLRGQKTINMVIHHSGTAEMPFPGTEPNTLNKTVSV